MADDRPAIPAELRRRVLVEAGHRCAIATCRQVPVEIHHINQNNKDNQLHNLIALCPNDHTRAHRREIDRKALRMYKRNLVLIAGRYGDMERRLLDYFAEHSEFQQVIIDRRMDFEFLYLIEDGLLVKLQETTMVRIGGFTQGPVVYGLTDAGIDFVERWREGQAVDQL
jgi:hypothetical protein